jgi:RimJ/RimL family protein N-acetyltransferase
MDADRLFARPMEPGDMDLLAEWLLDIEDLALFDRTQTVPLSRAAVREIWTAEFAAVKPPTAFWFIVETAQNVPVAFGGLHSVNYVHGDTVIAILVAETARGRGIGLRTACLLLDVAFDRLRLRRVTTFFRADNQRTARLVRQVGFKEEGRMRGAWFVDGRSVDTMVVGLLRDEWYDRRALLRSEVGDEARISFAAPRMESSRPPSGDDVTS